MIRKKENMTNYKKLFQAQMQNSQFVKAKNVARVERIVDEMSNTLKDKSVRNEPKKA